MSNVETPIEDSPLTERSNVPYRTAFELKLDFRDSVARVREQLRTWLREKQYDVERFDNGSPSVGHQVVLLHVAKNAVCGWQLRESKLNGVTWVSTIAVRGNARRQTWVSVNIEPTAPRDVNVPATAPPNLVRLLLDAVDAFDGEAQLRSQPIAVHSESDVEDLLEIVCAEDRRLPVVVGAAPIGVPFEGWRRDTARLMRDLVGLSSLYVLDPASAQRFNAGIGEAHWIGGGSIRTYLPGVDPAVEADALRHRVLSRRRIEAEPRRAARVLAALPRQLAANSLPPAALRGLDLSLTDFSRSAIPRQRRDSREQELTTEVGVLTSLLESADDAERQLKDTVSQQQDELLDLTADLELTRNELELRDATIRALRKRLADLDRHAEAYAPADVPDPLPTSFAEVFYRLDQLVPFVFFTGDSGPALDLDEHAAHSSWAQLAWQTLLAFADYARAKQEGWSGGDFKLWCETPADGGRVISAGKVARDESETVRKNKKFASERTLPVPGDVVPDGHVFMGAHVRLGTSATVSPRMHFYDATSSHHAIYVGYIGRHLPNTSTSRA